MLRNLVLNFGPIVRVQKSIRKMTMLNVINDIGSSMGLWLGLSTYSIFKMLQSASSAWGNKKVVIFIISTMLTYLPMLQHALYAWATGKMGRVLSLLFATLVTLVLFALGGVFIYFSVDA